MVARRIHHDIRIRRRVFPTVAAAAAALGVAQSTIYEAIKSGRLDDVGRYKRRGGNRPMPIAIRGRTFVDARTAAAHFGVSRAAIYQALHDGSIDRIGRKRIDQTPNSTPITICGRTWPSVSALSRWLGWAPNYVHVARARGRMQAVTNQVVWQLAQEAARAENTALKALAEETSSQRGRGTTRAEGAKWTKDRAG